MTPAVDYLRAALLLLREQLWEEAMAFKGTRPDKGDKGKDDILAAYRELVRIQSEVIHALAAALAATEADEEEDEDEEDEDEDEEDKDK